ncbi:GNAT family N-acetyltransferase [Kitasatospora sp. NPDC004240]
MNATSVPLEPQPFVRTTLDLGDIVLRPWGRETARGAGVVDALVSAADDPDIALWNPIAVVAREDVEARMDRYDARWDSGEAATFAVLDAAEGALLGACNLRWVDRSDGLAMIGYWMLPAARGRGVATRATLAVTRWGIRTAGARRIEIAHAVGNGPSCRVAERCGYPAEGTLRDSHRFGDGKYHDEHLHARLATDPEPA